jgi:hypothetical protein
MTADRVRELKIGIYRIYWTEGGSSIAAVGITQTGDKWIAPLNWVHPSENMEVWEKVEEAVPLRLGWV